MAKKLKAPFHAFGGKSRIASMVWDRLGDVDNAIEPFANSAAWLLARPHPPRVETLNDMDALIANFWRATKYNPEEVAEWADWPVNEAELHAVHRWLVLGKNAAEFRRRMRTDPDYYDAKVAGRWCWGLCQWIGSGWCGSYGRTEDGDVQERRPLVSAPGSESGRGVHAKMPNCDRRGVHGNDGAGTCAQRREWLLDWFSRLRDRLRTVRVCCGHWLRVCDSPSVTTRSGVTGIFLDPPYRIQTKDGHANRDGNLYANDTTQDVNRLVDDVIAYCRDRGGDPMMRIAACCLDGEGYEVLLEHGWECVAWKSVGGYGNQDGENANRHRERVFFSPHCLKVDMPLFGV